MSNNLHISGGVVYFVSGTVPPTFSQSINSNGETNEHVIYPDTTLSSFKSFMLLDPLDNSSFIISGSNPTSSIYMSSSGKFGFGTTDPLVDFDIRTNEFQIQKQGKRQGIKVNKEGNLESYNSETSAAATGSEFIISYSRGGAGAITSQVITTIMGVSIGEINAAGGATAFFSSLDPKSQDKLLFLLEDPSFSKLTQSSVGDVLGSIRWVATSGSSTGLNSRTAGEAASIQAVVNIANQFGTSADLLFKVAGKAALQAASEDLGAAGATQTALRLDGSFSHELTGSLSMTGNLVVNSLISHRGDPDTYLQFSNDVFRITAGGQIMMQFINHTQDQVLIGDGGDIDFRVASSGNGGVSSATPSFFVEGSSGEVGIGTNSPSHKLDVHGNARITGSLTVGHLEATSINTTEITSSIVSSSIIYSSGSNIFGDALVDTHLFNGHITASGNISSSGVLTVNTIIGSINGGSF